MVLAQNSPTRFAGALNAAFYTSACDLEFTVKLAWAMVRRNLVRRMRCMQGDIRVAWRVVWRRAGSPLLVLASREAADA
jgi:hypothetical protein